VLAIETPTRLQARRNARNELGLRIRMAFNYVREGWLAWHLSEDAKMQPSIWEQCSRALGTIMNRRTVGNRMGQEEFFLRIVISRISQLYDAISASGENLEFDIRSMRRRGLRPVFSAECWNAERNWGRVAEKS
jgi:hypothetical protein